MKQVVQPLSGGPVRVLDVPRPQVAATEVLVQTLASVISPGTEGAVTQLARASLLAKAKARPDLVRQVVKKARTDGIVETAQTVRSRLAGDLPLGYSAAGRAVRVGEAVTGIRPGQLVATGGAGKANHAEFQAVPGLLCTAVPDGVPVEDAAFATVASIALHGLRLAEVGPGSKVVVVGLGLLGQLGVRLAQAAGCDVAGVDVTDFAVERAGASGALALEEAGADTTAAVLAWSRTRGADAVLVTAASSSSDLIMRIPELCRHRATIVVVGDVGLDLQRTPFYDKELTLRFARSYGPGRYELSYEGWGVDYPPEYVRWTEGRNLEAVLDLLAAGKLAVADLVTHRVPIEHAQRAYELVASRAEPFLAIKLEYPDEPRPDEPVRVAPRRPSRAGLGVGFVGAGAFASTVLLPSFKRAGFSRFVAVASASGLSARRLAERGSFEKAVSDADAVIDDPDVDVVVIATPHDRHAELAAKALRAGKHVFCEKPLALTIKELDEVEAAWRDSGRVLFVGFNRRWSEAVALAKEHLSLGSGPLVVTYRINAGAVPDDHWYHDRRQGGRLIGEVCHFVDTAAALVGRSPVQTTAVASGAGGSPQTGDFVATCAFADGSLATISYATAGHDATGKERIDILGRCRTVTITDFRQVWLDGSAQPLGRGDKGHRAQAAAFRTACTGGAAPTADMLTAMRAVLAAAASLESRPHDQAFG